MTNFDVLAVNIDLCMGCLACETACQQEHHFMDDKKGIKLFVLGPKSVDGELRMDFVPMTTDVCDLCFERINKRERPFCSEICPTKAIIYMSDEETLKQQSVNTRLHICKIRENN